MFVTVTFSSTVQTAILNRTHCCLTMAMNEIFVLLTATHVKSRMLCQIGCETVVGTIL